MLSIIKVGACMAGLALLSGCGYSSGTALGSMAPGTQWSAYSGYYAGADPQGINTSRPAMDEYLGGTNPWAPVRRR